MEMCMCKYLSDEVLIDIIGGLKSIYFVWFQCYM